MQLTLLHGYPDFVGKRATFVGWGKGPAAYNATTGDVVTLPQRTYYIDALAGGVLTVSGNFFVRSKPSGIGPRQEWALFWYEAAGGTDVGDGDDLSAEEVQIGGFCGQF